MAKRKRKTYMVGKNKEIPHRFGLLILPDESLCRIDDYTGKAWLLDRKAVKWRHIKET